jgi:hypothetical protein
LKFRQAALPAAVHKQHGSALRHCAVHN